MIFLRELFSLCCFIVATGLIVTLFTDGFTITVLGGVVILFLAAYAIWPSKKRGKREGDHWLLDIIEFFIELPVDIFFVLLRFIGRLFRSKGSGIDLDF